MVACGLYGGYTKTAQHSTKFTFELFFFYLHSISHAAFYSLQLAIHTTIYHCIWGLVSCTILEIFKDDKDMSQPSRYQKGKFPFFKFFFILLIAKLGECQRNKLARRKTQGRYVTGKTLKKRRNALYTLHFRLPRSALAPGLFP